jgi:hypothetical protein
VKSEGEGIFVVGNACVFVFFAWGEANAWRVGTESYPRHGNSVVGDGVVCEKKRFRAVTRALLQVAYVVSMRHEKPNQNKSLACRGVLLELYVIEKKCLGEIL